ncbi:MAG: hypothetical protein IJ785_07890 [Bacteroidales bacterium]|nr:hypothetical protein [Bacteroidales bacterium]
MGKTENKTFGYTGRIAGQGITLYRRRGKVYARISTRAVTNRQSMGQFKARAKMRHSIALWNSFLTPYKPQMAVRDGMIAYNAFLRANSALPTVYLVKQQAVQGAALLMPGMVVSEGRLPAVEYNFAVLEGGERVVLTNLLTGFGAETTQELAIGCNDDLRQLLCTNHRNPQLVDGDTVRCYRLRQLMEGGCPKVKVECCEVRLDNDLRANPSLPGWQFITLGGQLAIGGADDEEAGWAVAIHNAEERDASMQQVLTTCQLYRDYTTDEALAAAAESYGNVEPPERLTPNAYRRQGG